MTYRLLRHGIVQATFYSEEHLQKYLVSELGARVPEQLKILGYSIKQG